jgi:hypothetical protein
VKTTKKVSYTTATVKNRIAGWVDLAGRCGYNVPRHLLKHEFRQLGFVKEEEMKAKAVWVSAMIILVAAVGPTQTVRGDIHLYVDATRGSDRADGSRASPLNSLYAAIKRLPKQINQDATIHVAAGRYTTTGGKGLNAECLQLNRPMYNGAKVQIVAETAHFEKPAPPGGAVLNWQTRSSRFLIAATQGNWTLENIQIGTRKPGQQAGISVAGPALLELRDVRIHTAGQKGPGLRAHNGGRIYLYGNIELNEDLREAGGKDDNFCRIEAEYAGVVKFMQRGRATLTLGNGNLSAAYYGVIELGCEQASITSWNYQSNPIAVNNSGRIDLHNTTTTVCARNPKNTPIGLEHDGHVLAEGARIIIEGRGNSNAIVIQKASTLFCNDVEIRGQVRHPLLAMSGSVLLVGINGDLGETFATTCASIIIEKCTGRLIGPVKETKYGQVVLPEGKADSGSSSTRPDEAVDPATLPALHRAAYGGHIAEATRLIEKGADMRGEGPNGWTPLHLAAIAGHRMLSQMLMDEGAEIRARDENGCTAAELAAVYGHTGLAQFLRKKESEAK